MTDAPVPPGPALRDGRYQDLCTFFKTMPDGQGWQPHIGDWVIRRPGEGMGVISAVDDATVRVAPIEGGEAIEEAAANLTWLPSLDQLRSMMLEAFGATGCFTSAFNGRAWWFSGNIMGMTVTNLVPLAEGGSAEEAAINALLMRHQR